MRGHAFINTGNLVFIRLDATQKRREMMNSKLEETLLRKANEVLKARLRENRKRGRKKTYEETSRMRKRKNKREDLRDMMKTAQSEYVGDKQYHQTKLFGDHE
jgi:hypothetical protein